MTRVMLALMLAASPVAASVGEKPAPRAEVALELKDGPELGRPFGVEARVRFHVAARDVTVATEAPSGVTVSGGALAETTVEAGRELSVRATLRASEPISGGELKVSVRFVEGHPVEEHRTVSRSMFLTIDRNEGGEGMPGDLWTVYLPAAFGGDAGYVLRGYGVAEGELGKYGAALKLLVDGKAEAAARAFEELAPSRDAELSVAAGNALAVACAMSGDTEGAVAGWAGLLHRDDLTQRVKAYVRYNRGLLLRRRDELEAALRENPGFTAARRALERRD